MKRFFFWIPMTLILSVQLFGSSSSVVLRDGSTVAFQGAPAVELNMLAVTSTEGHRILLSRQLIDLVATWRAAPAVVMLLDPAKARELGAAKQSRKSDTAKPRVKKEQKSFSITNDSLKAYSDEKGDGSSTNPFGDSVEQPAVAIRGTMEDRPKPVVSNRPVIKTIVHDGSRVNLQAHLEPGKLTIFDFYADWCGPCRVMDPKLKQLVRDFPNKVALKKIDIVRWGTPVTQQYNVRAIPYVLLMNDKGDIVKQGGTNIINHVKRQARRGW